jgi:superfamily II DNA/RNA helicase
LPRASNPIWSNSVSPTFAELGVSAGVVARLADGGILEPFAIQVDAVPAGLAGRDVCGKAPTGSGKTLAFGIPVSERVPQAAPSRPAALILAPTRELASQIMRAIKPLLHARKRTVAAVYGGVGFGQQITALRRGVDVLVACPGRLADLVNRRDVSLADVRIVVLDEADRMADMGFLPEVKRLLDQTHSDRQTLLFSATLDGDVDVLVKRYQHDPIRCEVAAPDDDEAMAKVSHEFIDVAREDRVITTAKLVIEHGSAIVFCRTKHGADRVARQLTAAGVTSVAIHGNRSQGQRDRAISSFAGGQAQAMVATDVAARGIHIDDVGCVVHFDLPPETKDYTHRSGRTGRAGAGGVVVSLVTPEERSIALKLQRELGLIESPAPTHRERPAGRAPSGGRGGGRRGGGSRGPGRGRGRR